MAASQTRMSTPGFFKLTHYPLGEPVDFDVRGLGRRLPRTEAPEGSVVALVRPEQLTLSTKSSGNGMPGTVTRTQFHGHDTVITIEPTSDLLLAPAVLRDPTVDQHLITVRADGNLVVADGTPVEITAAGSVVTWPATS